MIKLSVIIPAYNPGLSRLTQTLSALKDQDLDRNLWELIIVDNNSSVSFSSQIDISWHPDSKIISEPRQGLTYARLKGFEAAKGELLVMADDDNVLQKDYLRLVTEIFDKNPYLGAAGGKSLPIFENTPPEWLPEFYASLALRNLGEDVIADQWENKYPASAPVGAGMAIRKAALKNYIEKLQTGENIIADRKGNSLASGGDNDMVIEILKAGWQTGYFPSLVLHHIIPEVRMKADYIAQLNEESSRSWIELLKKHGISPWGKISALSVPFRKMKAWLTYKAWKNEVNYIKWRGACGMFEGMAE